MTLSLRLLCTTLFAANFLVTPSFGEGSRARAGETSKDAARKQADALAKEQAKAARAQTEEAARQQRLGNPGAGAAGAGKKLGEGAVSTDPRRKSGDHAPGAPAIKATNPGDRSSRFAADVLKDTAFTKRMADKLVRDPEGKITGIDPKVKARGEKVEAMKLADNYGKLKGAFNASTMKDHAKKLGEIRDALKKSKLTAEEKATLETAILVFLKEVEKDPKAAADAMKQLDDLLKDFSDELADADPKMREMALKYMLGTLAFYGKSVEGKVQLSVAKELWNTTQGTAREGLADMMEARAKLHSEFIADQIAKGKGASEIDYAAAWKHVEDGTVDWALARLAANGEDLSKLPDTVRDILCKCSKHAAACKV